MPPPLDSLHTPDSLSESNPWSDSVPTPVVTPPLHTPRPDTLEEVPSGGVKATDDHTQEFEPQAHRDALGTFDPLAHQEEQYAREAWANAEGHPPPPAPPKPNTVTQAVPPQPQEAGAASSSSTFSSFSSLARSLALPSLPNMNISLVAGTRARPQSIDSAVVLPTPIHAGSFSSQQDAEIEARGSPKIMDAAAVPSTELVQNVLLRRDTPSRERQGGKEKEPSFDFQKFLDQMKTKSAEPVARYLRSSVPSSTVRLTSSLMCRCQISEQLCKTNLHGY
jgi:Rab5 GDP/GTP exchange factor